MGQTAEPYRRTGPAAETHRLLGTRTRSPAEPTASSSSSPRHPDRQEPGSTSLRKRRRSIRSQPEAMKHQNRVGPGLTWCEELVSSQDGVRVMEGPVAHLEILRVSLRKRKGVMKVKWLLQQLEAPPVPPAAPQHAGSAGLHPGTRTHENQNPIRTIFRRPSVPRPVAAQCAPPGPVPGSVPPGQEGSPLQRLLQLHWGQRSQQIQLQEEQVISKWPSDQQGELAQRISQPAADWSSRNLEAAADWSIRTMRSSGPGRNRLTRKSFWLHSTFPPTLGGRDRGT